MAGTPGELSIVVEADGDQRYVSELASGLQEDLLLLDVASVEPLQIDPPPGAKSDAGMAIGAFAVSGALSASLLNAIVKVVVAWLDRSGARAVTLEQGGDRLVLQGVGVRDQRALIANWIAQQAEGRGNAEVSE
jgi:hypothetical protein